VASRRRWGLHVGGLRRGGLRGRGLECRVRRISTAELERLASRPAYSVLRSERAGAPALPDWREGLRACLAEMDG
jgi:dTDP-4-dehydrorhamnose reductase